MNKKHFALSLCLALLFAVGATTTLFADEWDQATQLTFSEPVEVPGLVLPAGAYWFKLADSDADRNIVQIWNADRTHLVTTVLAVPDYRMQPTDKTVISFAERPSGSPEAIHAWFYPGNNYGEEFVYPKTRATQLAQQTKQPVLAVRSEQPPTDLKAPVIGINPSGEEVEVSEIVASQPVQLAAARGALPQTASPVPLIALFGLVILAGAVALRVARPTA